VAKQLGNTRSICKKYYVHPAVIELYEHNDLWKTVTASTGKGGKEVYAGLTDDENLLMAVLERKSFAVSRK
jgi:DNA topoisomerase-1